MFREWFDYSLHPLFPIHTRDGLKRSEIPLNTVALCQNTVKTRVADMQTCFYFVLMTQPLPPILQFVYDAQVFNLSKLDHFCAFPRGSISRAIRGTKPLTERQLRKLVFIFRVTEIGPLSVVEEQIAKLKMRE